jgi:hypothetical protein
MTFTGRERKLRACASHNRLSPRRWPRLHLTSTPPLTQKFFRLCFTASFWQYSLELLIIGNAIPLTSTASQPMSTFKGIVAGKSRRSLCRTDNDVASQNFPRSGLTISDSSQNSRRRWRAFLAMYTQTTLQVWNPCEHHLCIAQQQRKK